MFLPEGGSWSAGVQSGLCHTVRIASVTPDYISSLVSLQLFEEVQAKKWPSIRTSFICAASISGKELCSCSSRNERNLADT